MNEPTRISTIHGTWGWNGLETEGQWWQLDSLWWSQLMIPNGFVPVCLDPFSWTAHVNPTVSFRSGRRLVDWEAGAVGFYRYLRPPVTSTPDAYVPIRHRNVIVHSHGCNVLIIALAKLNLRINSAILVAPPVRSELEPYFEAAVANCGYMVQIHSDWSDRMQVLGELFDETLGIKRAYTFTPKVAARGFTDKLPGIGHSEILNDPKRFELWSKYYWLDMLKANYGMGA